MTLPICCRKASRVVMLLLACALPLAISGAERGKTKVHRIGEFNPADESVDMFAAMKEDKIKVKLIAKDSTEVSVLIENVSSKPLNVQLPEAFAGVPVLAQFGGGGMMGGRGGGMGGGMMGGGMSQPMGGGMGGMGGGGGMGRGMGGGMFNVPAEKKVSFKVPVVCLEHGKPNPRPPIAYEIRPLDSFTSKPGVRELCMMLGYNKISQRGAQVAAWNLNSDMSWQELANKQIKRLNGDSYPYFDPQEMQEGMAIVSTSLALAKEFAKNPKPAKSPGTPQTTPSNAPLATKTGSE